MKKNLLLFLLPLIGLFTGCIKENMDDCHRSFTLLFAYNGDGTTDIFRQKVTKVNLYVYNTETREMVQSHVIDRSALETLQGIRLDDLAPGSYEAICWGNAYDHSEIAQPQDQENGSIAAPEYNDGTPISTNDEIYYGQKPFTITNAWKDRQETCQFRCAHIDMYVRLEGFDNIAFTDTRANDRCPVAVQLTELPGYCDFTGTPRDEHTTYNLEMASTKDNAAIYESAFSTLRFKDECEVALQLLNPATGTPFYSLPLKQFMADNQLSVEDRQEASLNILLKLNSDGISMTVSPFESEDIHPGLDEKDM